MGVLDLEYGADVALETLLRSIDRPGDVCANGRLFAPMPRLEVEGAGMLSVPVPEAQVRALIAAAERAPYGKGPDTLVDTSVRDCWQIGPKRIRLAGGAWAGTFAKILDAAASGLGCPGDRLADQAVRDLFARAWRWRLTTEAETAAGAIAGQPQFATPDRTLPAALRELHGEEGLADTAAFATLWRHATGSLLKRSAIPPKEPRHCKFAADIDCKCDRCDDLRAFCKDPAAKTARFPLRKDLRAHLHQVIARHRLDIDHETERRGRPYTLVCTKNRESHRRRLAEYSKDVSWMRRLIRSAPGGAQAAQCAPEVARLQEAVAASGRK